MRRHDTTRPVFRSVSFWCRLSLSLAFSSHGRLHYHHPFSYIIIIIVYCIDLIWYYCTYRWLYSEFGKGGCTRKIGIIILEVIIQSLYCWWNCMSLFKPIFVRTSVLIPLRCLRHSGTTERQHPHRGGGEWNNRGEGGGEGDRHWGRIGEKQEKAIIKDEDDKAEANENQNDDDEILM